MSLVKLAVSKNYHGSLYERAADELAIERAKDNEYANTKGPYLSSTLIGTGLGAATFGLGTKSGIGTLVGAGLGAFTGLGIASTIHSTRAQNMALAKNKKLAEKYELIQKLRENEYALNNDAAMKTGLYSSLMSQPAKHTHFHVYGMP